MDACFDAVPAGYAALAAADATFAGAVSRVKRVTWSRGLSWLGISGIYIGLTAEANVNVDQPPLLLFHSAAHETAHQLGLASENEADFVAFLACMRAEAPAVRYSGAMLALIRCANALYAADAERYFAIADACYSDGMRRDLSAYNAYWGRVRGPCPGGGQRGERQLSQAQCPVERRQELWRGRRTCCSRCTKPAGEAALFPES